MSSIKTYKDSYLYNNKIFGDPENANRHNAVIKDFVLNSHRIEDKESEAFRGVVEDVKRQQMSSILFNALLMDNVKLCINKTELPRAFKVFEALDIKNGKRPTVFIDVTGLIEFKNGYYSCRKIDVLITYLLEALVYLDYRFANSRTLNNSIITISATECFVSMFTFTIDFTRAIGFVSNKSKISYLAGLYFLNNLMGKELDSYTKGVAAKVAGIDNKAIRAYDLYLDDDIFNNIDTFVSAISSTFGIKGLTTEVFVSKWIYIYGIGTQYGCDLFTSFVNILAATYVGSYIVHQKQIEKSCGLSMVKLISEIFKVGVDTFSRYGFRESSDYIDKNTEQLASAMKNKEVTNDLIKLRSSDFSDEEVVTDKIEKALNSCNETYQPRLIAKLIENTINTGLKAITDYIKEGKEYSEGSFANSLKILKGNFNQSINKSTVMVESKILDLQDYSRTVMEEASKEEKQKVSRCIKELRESFRYIK